LDAFWGFLTVLGWALAFVVAAAVSFTLFVLIRYSKYIVKVFTTKPLLIAETSPHRDGGEAVELKTESGRTLRGSYFHSTAANRRGVVLFCHEYSGDRWLWETYLGPLLAEGCDVFAFDFCNHGKSDSIPGYSSTQWITLHEVEDAGAAMDYLKTRSDADPAGIRVFGVSKGAGSAIAAMASRPWVRDIVVDGLYPNHGMVIEYEQKWVCIFSGKRWIYENLPRAFFSLLCEVTLFRLERRFGLKYARIESALRRLGSRRLLAIRGARDNYVTATITERMLSNAPTRNVTRWTVKGAKHNLCVQVAGEEYHRRLMQFWFGDNESKPSSMPSSETSTLEPAGVLQN
jgi:pimeloyl-ACP methyl ester carboxylesterase